MWAKESQRRLRRCPLLPAIKRERGAIRLKIYDAGGGTDSKEKKNKMKGSPQGAKRLAMHRPHDRATPAP